MSETAVVYLGIIAASVVVLAAVQVGLVIAAFRLTKRIEAIGRVIEVEIRPLLANITAASATAVQVAEVALAQVERVDRLFTDLVERFDATSRIVQSTLLSPLREGRALLAAIVAAFGAMREARSSGRPSADGDDDDPLFIG